MFNRKGLSFELNTCCLRQIKKTLIDLHSITCKLTVPNVVHFRNYNVKGRTYLNSLITYVIGKVTTYVYHKQFNYSLYLGELYCDGYQCYCGPSSRRIGYTKNVTRRVQVRYHNRVCPNPTDPLSNTLLNKNVC